MFRSEDHGNATDPPMMPSRWILRDGMLILFALLVITALSGVRFVRASQEVQQWLVAAQASGLADPALDSLRAMPRDLPARQALERAQEQERQGAGDAAQGARAALVAVLREELLHQRRDAWLLQLVLPLGGLATLAWFLRHARRDDAARLARMPLAGQGSAAAFDPTGDAHTRAAVDLILEVNRLLDEAPLGEAAFENVLRRLVPAFGVRSAAIHVLEEQVVAAPGIAGTLSTTGVLQALFDFEPWTVRASRIRTMLQEDVDVNVAAGGRSFALIMLPLLEHGRHIGQLAFEAEAGTRFSEVQAKTALAIARQISVTIGSFNVAHDLRRVALFEERSAIARELHDSLAQSLAFMKIQISRLQAALEARKPPETTAAVLRELRDGLNGAYRKLRELLTTFRVNIGPGGLQAGLEESVQEVRERSAMAVTLDWRMGNCRLSSNEEIHVLHVVREALSNAIRHAEADRLAIALEYDADRYLTVTVEDDGRGVEEAADRRFHHGVSIMEDRVASLGGSLVIDARPGGGTRVRFRFTPSWSGSRDLLSESVDTSDDQR